MLAGNKNIQGTHEQILNKVSDKYYREVMKVVKQNDEAKEHDFWKARLLALTAVINQQVRDMLTTFDPRLNGNDFFKFIMLETKKTLEIILSQPAAYYPEKIHQALQYAFSTTVKQIAHRPKVTPEGRERFCAWAFEECIYGSTYPELVLLSAHKFFPWMISMVQSMSFPEGVTNEAILMTASYELTRCMWEYDPGNGLPFEKFAEPRIQARLQILIFQKSVTPEQIEAGEADFKHVTAALPPLSVPSRILANVNGGELSGSETDATELSFKLENERKQRVITWARDYQECTGIEYLEIIRELRKKYEPFAIGIVKRTPFDKQKIRRKELEKAAKYELNEALCSFDPAHDGYFHTYAEQRIENRIKMSIYQLERDSRERRGA